MKYVFVFMKHRAMCSSAEEAEEFINSLTNIKRYGIKENLVVNNVCRSKLQALFNTESHKYYPSGMLKSGVDDSGKETNIPPDGFSTTGIGDKRILYYEALADTLEEHQAIYEENCKIAKEQRIKEANERIAKRKAELNEVKEGWYHVNLWCKMVRYEDMRFVDYEFSGDCIAKSGADAYHKAVEHLKESEGSFFDASSMLSNDYTFTYLGVKDDDGYTGLTWEELEAGKEE